MDFAVHSYIKEDFRMVSAGDFRNGLTIEFEGNVYFAAGGDCQGNS